MAVEVTTQKVWSNWRNDFVMRSVPEPNMTEVIAAAKHLLKMNEPYARFSSDKDLVKATLRLRQSVDNQQHTSSHCR